jgi:cytochrome c-type biogenesis protein
MNYAIGIVFLAGLVSFLSPCVLSIVPAYISYLTENKNESNEKQTIINRSVINGFFFVSGFSFIFITMGLSASLIGHFLYLYKHVLLKIGGIVIIIFGLQLTGLISIALFNFDYRVNNSIISKKKIASSFLMGVFFSAGWSPCIGPVLGSILTAVTVNDLSTAQGVLYLAIYSLGLGIPFIGAAMGVGWVNTILLKYKRVTHIIQVISGVLLVIFGILIFFDIISKLNKFSPAFQIG